MIQKKILLRTMFLALSIISFPVFSQIVGGNMQIWEKAPASYVLDSTRCRNSKLLNFNCDIKGKMASNTIKYHKSKAHSLIAVHNAGDDEWLWLNNTNRVNLGNNKYQKLKVNQTVNLIKRPSLYSYVSPVIANDSLTVDSIKIKFEDKNLYEIIFTPKKIKFTELRKIQSYLAIKYGISLEEGKYFDSSNKVIWDPAKHKNYKYRPTGLGRDDGHELYQKQSSNQQDKFLTIGKQHIKRTNFENTSIWDNKTFVFWSDDNKEMTFWNDGTQEVLKRSWEINFIGSVDRTDYKIRVEKSILNPQGSPALYWLLLNKSDGTVQKVQGTENGNRIVFDNVSFDTDKNSSTTFTFAKTPNDSELSRIDNKHGENWDSEEAIRNEMVLYPNPVKTNEIFTVAFPQTKGLVITIYDGGGRVVSQKSIEPQAVKFYSQLGVQGVYLISLTQYDKPLKTFKLIVK